MSIRLGSRVVYIGYLDDELENKVGTVVARDSDGWLLVQFDNWYGGHAGRLNFATKIKKGFTEGGNSCWWCSESSLNKVEKGVK